MTKSSTLHDLEVLGTFIKGIGNAARTDGDGYDGEANLYWATSGTNLRLEWYSMEDEAWHDYVTEYSLTELSNGDDADGLHTHASMVDRHLEIPAKGMVEPSSNGAPVGQVNGTNISYDGRLFDKDTEEHADFNFWMPANYNSGTINVTFIWTAAAGSGTVSWELNVISRANDDPIDAALTDVGSATDTLLATGDLHAVSMAWSSTLPSTENQVYVRVSRDVAADNLSGDALLKMVIVDWAVG